MRTLLKLLPILVITLLLTACHKDEDDSLIPENAETRTLTGRVIDKNGKPMAGINVEMYFNMTKGLTTPAVTNRLKAKATTNANGVYKLTFYRQEDEKKYSEDNNIFTDYTVSIVGLCDSHFCGNTASYYDIDKFWENDFNYIDDFKLFRKRGITVKIQSAPQGFNAGDFRVKFEEAAGGQTGAAYSFSTIPALLSVDAPVGQTISLIRIWGEQKDTTIVKIGDTEPTFVELGY